MTIYGQSSRGTDAVIVDVDPPLAVCACGPKCEFPCWQRVGIAPPCAQHGCAGSEAQNV